MSKSQSQPQKRPVTDFFKPYWRSIPSKPPSPTPENHHGHDRSPKKPKKAPKTPSATRFTDFSPSTPKSPFKLALSPNLPIRSPPPKEQGTPAGLRSNLFS